MEELDMILNATVFAVRRGALTLDGLRDSLLSQGTEASEVELFLETVAAELKVS